MSKVSDLQMIVGKRITSMTWLKFNLSLSLERGISFNVPSYRSFWRISDGNNVLLTSEDFFVKATSSYSYEYVPINDKALDQLKALHNDLEMDDLYEYLDEEFEKRETKLGSLLSGAVVLSAEEKEYGDFKLLLSSGVSFEVFAGCDYSNCDSSHLYVLTIREG